MLSNQCAWGKGNREVPEAKDHPGHKRWCWDTRAPLLLVWVLPPPPTFERPPLLFSRALPVIPFRGNRILCPGCEEPPFSKSGEPWAAGRISALCQPWSCHPDQARKYTDCFPNSPFEKLHLPLSLSLAHFISAEVHCKLSLQEHPGPSHRLHLVSCFLMTERKHDNLIKLAPASGECLLGIG